MWGPRLQDLTLWEEKGVAIGVTPALSASSGWHTWLLLHKRGLGHFAQPQISILLARGCRRWALGLPTGSKFVCRVSDTEILYWSSTEKILLHRVLCTDALRQKENTRLTELSCTGDGLLNPSARAVNSKQHSGTRSREYALSLVMLQKFLESSEHLLFFGCELPPEK